MRGPIERGEAPHILLADVSSALQQPCHQVDIGRLHGNVQWRRAVAVTRLNQRTVFFKQAHRCSWIAMKDGCADLILHWGDRCIWAAYLLAPQPLFFFDNGDNVAVLTIPGQAQR
jgi:hypothetical protein